MKKILSLVGIAAAMIGFGSEAHALEKYQSRTRGAQASYTAYESTECTYGGLSVWAFEEIGSGNQTAYESIYVDFYAYDFCTGIYQSGFGYVEASTFDINRLQSASLEGTGSIDLQICDYSGGGGGGEDDGGVYYDPCSYSSAPLAVSLDWAGTGDTFRERSSSTYSTPNARYRTTTSGQTREATVTGEVTIDGDELSFSEGYGQLAQTQSGSFEMYR